MKTFDKINVGESVYKIDDEFRIKEVLVSGIEDVGLCHRKVSIKLISGRSFVSDFGATKVTTNDSLSFFSCLESANIERNDIKYKFVEKQFNIALAALRSIKKFEHDISKQKERILKLFQLLEKES